MGAIFPSFLRVFLKKAFVWFLEIQQARTAEEMEDDLNEDEIDADEDTDDEEEKAIYNPKNVPLGWVLLLSGGSSSKLVQL